MMNNMGSESSLLGGVLKGPPVRRAIKSTADYDIAQQTTQLFPQFRCTNNSVQILQKMLLTSNLLCLYKLLFSFKNHLVNVHCVSLGVIRGGQVIVPALRESMIQ